jgi:hypothetical protein
MLQCWTDRAAVAPNCNDEDESRFRQVVDEWKSARANAPRYVLHAAQCYFWMLTSIRTKLRQHFWGGRLN